MLKIEGLKKQYADFILECSLSLPQGCVCGLIGQNGSGKSTTFKSILGLIHYNEGKIELFGKEIKTISENDLQRIGVVLSDSGFSGYLSIENIIPILKKMYLRFDETYFRNQCHRFNLPQNKKIKEFSTGMKAKLKMIVALSHHADLLILDEPTSGLDVIARDEVLSILRDFMEEDEHHSILISSHISSDLESLCDEFYMIHQGKIIYHEETDVLLSDYAILKLNDQQYETIDHQYLLQVKKETYGYSCLTNQKQYYMENYPQIVIEKSHLDELIFMMVKGEKQ